MFSLIDEKKKKKKPVRKNGHWLQKTVYFILGDQISETGMCLSGI